MPRYGGDERVRGASRLQARGDEVRLAEHVVEWPEAFDIRVDVDAAVAVQDLEPQDVGPLDRSPQALENLRADRVRRQVILRPEPVIPPTVVALPALDPPASVVG